MLLLCTPVLNWAPRHEDVLGSGSIAPRILDLGTRWRWVVSFTLQPLYPQGKGPWYPFDRRWVSHYTHTDPYLSKTQHNINQYRQKCLKRGDVEPTKRIHRISQTLVHWSSVGFWTNSRLLNLLTVADDNGNGSWSYTKIVPTASSVDLQK
jgi:hypothetical protein